MMDRKELAAQYHAKGYNCAQSVACAFGDKVAMSEEDIFCVMEGFGLGMGGMRGTCGAISGAVAIISLVSSVGTSNTMNKKETYKIAKQMLARFEERNQVSLCHELKGIETGKVVRKCPDCISDAVEILEEILAEL